MRRRVAFAGALALACLAAALTPAPCPSSPRPGTMRAIATPATACRTFQRAHDATSPHGEIFALTSGDYRPVTVANIGKQ